MNAKRNIAIIRKIEYMLNATYTDIKFVSMSASYSSSTDTDKQGQISKEKLSFKMAGISDDNKMVVDNLLMAVNIKFTDVNYETYTLGDKDILPDVSYDTVNEGTPGGFVGYKITIDYNSYTPCF